MFYLQQHKKYQTEYQENLKILGSLSKLFSSSDTPFIYYRVAEKIFCDSFKANDLSRSDVAVDAKKDSLGIGLKTFLNGNGKSFQKVAEFNLSSLGDDPSPKKIAELRNVRIDFTEKAHGLHSSIYHCIVREANRFKIFEESMNKIDISGIGNIKKNKGSIHFDDGKDEYSFLLSKSTLAKRFTTKKIVHEFEVPILLNPLNELKDLLTNRDFSEDPKKKLRPNDLDINNNHLSTQVILPLYGSNKTVYSKSGLNQWNAGGRMRHPNEIYIPIPAKIHRLFPNFFPSRDKLFSLTFPDGEIVEASVCQQGSKALMTKSNKKLGKLILRDGLRLKENELATFEKLQFLGVDSVRIQKIDNLHFELDFSRCGSYELFLLNHSSI
jgi:hypothetical protein|tara:strand:+ start:1135 stop:2280 length:1146 start_codon:yes stop_codon:yes gene_type:complete